MSNMETLLRDQFLQELMEKVQETRLMFNGQIDHDSNMVHQCVVNYYNEKRRGAEFNTLCETEYAQNNILVEDILFDVCDNFVKTYCDCPDDDCKGLFDGENYASGEQELAKIDKVNWRKNTIQKANGGHTNNEPLLEALSAVKKVVRWNVIRIRSLTETYYKLKVSSDTIEDASPLIPKDVSLVRVPHGVKRIDDASFSSCARLTHIMLPDTLESIGNWAFSWCLNLKSIVIPPSLKEMGHNPFAVTSMSNVKSQSPHFKVCDGALIEVATGRMVSYLGQEPTASYDWRGRAIRNDRNVNDTYTVPREVKVLGRDCFRGRFALKHLTISEQVERILPNPIADTCIDEIVCLSPHFKVENKMLMSSDGTTIYAYFGKASSLEVPEGVTTIGEEAFLLCSLQEISLPTTLKDVPEEMFRGAEKIKKIYIPQGDAKQFEQILKDYPSLAARR